MLTDDLSGLWKDETGVTTVEYALLTSLVAVASLSAWVGLAQAVKTSMTNTGATYGTPVN